MNKTKRLYTTEFSVTADYTIEVTAINTTTLEKITEVFVVKDRVIFPELLGELPFELQDYEYNENYLTHGITLRDVVQCIIDRIRNDLTPVTY